MDKYEKGEMEKVDVHIDPSLLKEHVVENTVFRSTCDFRVTERDLKKAREELGETDETRSNCLKELKKMLNDKRVKYRMDDDYLLRFLRFRKFDVKKTYKFVQNFYNMRNEDPEIFTMPLDIQFKMNGKLGNVLPYTHEDGMIVHIHRMGNWNCSDLHIRDLCNMFSYVSDVLSMNPHAQIDGVIDIIDLEGLTAGHISHLLHPASVKYYTKFFQEVYPWRVKKIIVINCSAVLFASFYIVRLFLKKKIADRLVLIHSDLKELHKHVNPAILPQKYGGYLDDEECFSYLNKLVLSNKEYLQYENSFIGYAE